MPRRVLDTNVLIRHRGDELGFSRLDQISVRRATECGRRLVAVHQANAILTPIYVEFLCGHATAHSVRLARGFLSPFDRVDGGRILPADRAEAIRLAARVPRDGLRRQTGDCLIRAICDRLNLEVFTFERRFPVRPAPAQRAAVAAGSLPTQPDRAGGRVGLDVADAQVPAGDAQAGGDAG